MATAKNDSLREKSGFILNLIQYDQPINTERISLANW
jgi:hypothetical protein